MNVFDDRRKFPRFDVSLKVEFQNSKDANECFQGMTQNFSRFGCGVVLEKFDPEAESLVEFKLQLPGKPEAFVQAKGLIVWKKRIENKWYVGVNLEKMDKAVKMDILEFALSQWITQLSKT